jgi:CDP-diacylglycerol--serine O-phosphatidyltransferase
VKPVATLPSLFTLGNLFCGFLAIAKGADAITALWHAPVLPPDPTPADLAIQADVLARFHHLFFIACWLIFLANVFDALDGRLARITKTTSEFGAMLDSVADMVTFGAAPAFLLKFLFESERLLHEQTFKPKVVMLMCFLYVACAALRLARFTAETEEDADSHDFFKGLPSPAAALFVVTGILFFLYLDDPDAPQWLADRRGAVLTLLLASLPVLALLMVSRVKYVHVINRFMRGRHPQTYLAQIVVSLLLLALVHEYALVIVCMGYVVACPAVALAEKVFHRPLWPLRPRHEESENGERP